MKRSIVWLVILAVVLGLVWWLSRGNTTTNNNNAANNQTGEQAPVQVASPTPNQTVASPLVITGQAVGNWFFEASFPVELLNSQNQVIGQGIAQAQGDWMTTNFVPFTAQIVFPPQTPGSTGTLVLKKDNPSGEPQFDAQATVPVMF